MSRCCGPNRWCSGRWPRTRRSRARSPAGRRSGSSIRGERPPRGGNKQLKRAFFLSAFAALHNPVSRAYYDRKRAEGKKHNAALIGLARRRADVLHAMLRTGTRYEHRAARAA
jgi:transposase